ncbi:hypothetical protein ACJJTC_007056 [Scirpophaga incertulas]
MGSRLVFTAIAVILYSASLTSSAEDLPCRARDVGIKGRSIVCVCDANYCDTITREDPAPGTFVVYTSSNAGKRFEKTFGEIKSTPRSSRMKQTKRKRILKTLTSPGLDESEENNETSVWSRVNLRVQTNLRHQYIEGFGGSVTDAAAINWRKLSDAAQFRFIDTYFGPEGLEYNLIQDYFLKLPMIRRSQFAAPTEVKIVASTWSPPIWMKSNERITGFGQLRPEFYQTFADYHLRFIEEYSKAHVKIWAITTTNEPINGIVPWAPFNSLGWTPPQLARWITNNLGPTIRKSPFNDTLILAVDDQRYLLHFYMLGMEKADPKFLDYIDGIAIHYYGNFAPAQILTELHNRYGKMMLSTEACEGPMPWHLLKVEVGSWRRARRYITSILEDLNNFVVGWIDWNLCLDPEGGPNWADNFVDAAILVYAEKDEFIKQPMYYAMGHFSKFIPRGSRRVAVRRRSIMTLENLAVLNPRGNIVMVIQNRYRREMYLQIQISPRRYIELTMEPESVKTIEINDNLNS